MEEPTVEEDVNEINTTLLELQDALTAAMRETGVLGKLRAQLRAAAVSVMRGDPHLRDAAVAAGKIMQPSTLSREGRVALLVIEEFMQVHGLHHTAGVFEAESNVRLVGETEQAAMQKMRRLSSTGEKSTLERLLANTWPQDKPVVQGASTGSSSVPSTSPEHSVQLLSEEEEEEEEECEVPNNAEIATGLKEYDDSVDFSDVSIMDVSCVDKTSCDYEENF